MGLLSFSEQSTIKPEILPKIGNKFTSLEHQTVLQQCGQLEALLDGNRPLQVKHIW
jgi:chromosomal replication initiation ATPase DnaA